MFVGSRSHIVVAFLSSRVWNRFFSCKEVFVSFIGGVVFDFSSMVIHSVCFTSKMFFIVLFSSVNSATDAASDAISVVIYCR